jgi:hypothetical protein
MYTHIIQNMETLVGQKKYKNWDGNEYRLPRKTFHVPFWAWVP